MKTERGAWTVGNLVALRVGDDRNELRVVPLYHATGRNDLTEMQSGKKPARLSTRAWWTAFPAAASYCISWSCLSLHLTSSSINWFCCIFRCSAGRVVPDDTQDQRGASTRGRRRSSKNPCLCGTLAAHHATMPAGDLMCGPQATAHSSGGDEAHARARSPVYRGPFRKSFLTPVGRYPRGLHRRHRVTRARRRSRMMKINFTARLKLAFVSTRLKATTTSQKRPAGSF
jgi:hypothetical protein